MTKANSSAAHRPATRLSGIALSEIVQISERARQMRAEGRDVIALSTGEPDFPTPPEVIEAAHQAALAGQTRYTPTAGTPDLRAEVARQAGAEPANVIISTGAKQVLANTMLATLNPGDEVIMPAPFWTSYADIVRMAGGTPVVLPCPLSQNFKLTPEQLGDAITPQTRWLMLNSPSNPSGAIYSAEEYAQLADILDAHPHVWVVADEIYEHLSYTPFTSFADAAPHLRDRTIIVNGVSKAWSMTGWRIGWGIGPAELIRDMTSVQGQITSGASSVSQAAALAALQSDRQILEDRRATFLARRDATIDGLNAIPGLTCPAPDGAFYAFPDCSELIEGRFDNDAALCQWLLEETGVALVPGRAFGMPGHVRLSFAYAESQIREALTRMETAIDRLTSAPSAAFADHTG
ncbi:pyridoxal phosphate-dependent aminotransferase [Roseovarius indicus]|uniref:Aminotransferase n=1 Tax=Roseovarius indicus TaxID=540747 RepID=A0A0T5P1G0_9RHOB|nr:pyridoxal phosphate-dependent aminotransferase [Roseovarius indicus]KRS14988.1 aspartate aminotransferase [Roseovarius indicus]QEW28540.1 Aspartate aminotransferase [Roseovarius indicus]SFE08838.1 aspartate aminotransferase [Roseovarius indicus]